MEENVKPILVEQLEMESEAICNYGTTPRLVLAKLAKDSLLVTV